LQFLELVSGIVALKMSSTLTEQVLRSLKLSQINKILRLLQTLMSYKSTKCASMHRFNMYSLFEKKVVLWYFLTSEKISFLFHRHFSIFHW